MPTKKVNELPIENKTETKNGMISSSLKYNVDSAFFLENDTTNFQYEYDANKTINFFHHYYVAVFKKSSQSCLYCLVDLETSILTPFPKWNGCEVSFRIDSDRITVKDKNGDLNYRWDSIEQKFQWIPPKGQINTFKGN